MTSIASITPPYTLHGFTNGIFHPDLWLWDSWTYADGDKLHLYTLALNRKAKDGSAINPDQRNDHKFHIRHFESINQGKEWTDLGSILTSSSDPDSFYSRNVWSGSATKLGDNRILMSFTGIRELGAERPFLQNIAIATSTDGSAFDHIQSEPLSCPHRDYDAIIAAGYYLGPKADLGTREGEEGGPILAWRDPFTLIAQDGTIHCFWSAKVAPKEGAIAHATLVETGNGFEIETLHPPITLPDSNTITQAEVPKMYIDDATSTYYCLISACDRLYEGQDDCEVSKNLRLYKAENLRGPWHGYKKNSTLLSNLPDMFGASIIETDFETGELKIIPPITEQANSKLQLTLAPVQTINILDTDCEHQTATPSLHKIA